MSNAITLQQSVLADVVALMEDKDAMKSLRKFLDELIQKKGMQETVNNIRERMEEFRMARDGEDKQ